MGVESTEVKEIMTRELVTIQPQASLLEAANLMTQKKTSRLIVIDRETAVGIATKKDIIKFTSTDTTGRTLDKIPISECMTDSLVTEDQKQFVPKVAGLMLEYGISSVIITGKSENVVGIVTKTDLTRFYANRAVRRFRIRNWMSSPVITVQPTNSIYYAAELMTKHKISRLVVVETSVIGIVTMSDLVSVSPLLVAKIYAKDQTFFTGSTYIVPTIMFPHLTVADIMKTNVMTVREDADLAEGASLMVKQGVSGLPVLGGSLQLTGIVTKTDICRALARMSKD